MVIKPLPPLEFLRECLKYDPETGMLTWKERPRGHFKSDKDWKMWNTQFAGTKVLAVNKPNGYIRVKLTSYGQHQGHRIIWALQTGEDPGSMQIDHYNRNKRDNRWTNLRLATHWQNRVHSSGWGKSALPKGVFRSKRRFGAKCHVKGQIHVLGYFATAEEAHDAYLAFARQEHGEFFFNPTN